MLVTLLGMVTLVKPLQPVKRPSPNARYAVSDGHAGQTGAIAKRPSPNARYAVRDGHAGQICAIIKRPLPNARNAVGNNEHARPSAGIFNKHCLGFVVKHTIQTAIDGITCVNDYAGQTGAIEKRPIPNARNAVRDGHAGQTGAAQNAATPMLVTLFRMVTLVKPLHS